MELAKNLLAVISPHIATGNHAASDYFTAIKELVARRSQAQDPVEHQQWQDRD